MKQIRPGQSASKPIAETLGQAVIYKTHYDAVIAFILHEGIYNPSLIVNDPALEGLLKQNELHVVVRRRAPAARMAVATPALKQSTTMADYDLTDHRHRFAVWAAARASQRGFTTVEILREALESTGIRRVPRTPATLQLQTVDFEALHRQWCSSVCSTLSQRQIAKVTYGRAAKLVAVYLKATILMGEDWNTPFAHRMHPPIDRTLLQHLASSERVKSPHQAAWRFINWTQLTESAYYALVAQLREVVPVEKPFWTIEEHWQPIETE